MTETNRFESALIANIRPALFSRWSRVTDRYCCGCRTNSLAVDSDRTQSILQRVDTVGTTRYQVSLTVTRPDAPPQVTDRRRCLGYSIPVRSL